MLVVRSGPRNVQHAVYVGVEHWRQLHLHSWPCDRNRNEGSIISQQSATVQNRAPRICICVCVCVHARSRSEGYQDCHHGVLLGDGQDEVSKQSVSWFGQLSIRSRTDRSIACFANQKKNQGIASFSRQALIRVLNVGDHASKLRLTSLAVIRANLVTEIWTSRCLVMEPCEPPSTHKIVHCSPEARVEELVSVRRLQRNLCLA